MRFSKSDWLELGLQLLRQEGPSALTIERMTAAAEKTRGSFYHHFADREAFLTDMMAHWQRRAFEDRAAQVPTEGDTRALRAFLRAEPFFADNRLECSLRQLAAIEPVVQQAMQTVDRSRIGGLAILIGKLRPEVEDPHAEAFIQYAVMVGSQWLLEGPDDPRLQSVQQAAYRLFGLIEAG